MFCQEVFELIYILGHIYNMLGVVLSLLPSLLIPAYSNDVQLTKDFTLHDFNAGCNMPTPKDKYNNIKVLAQNLQIIKDTINKPIRILSGYRSPKCNKKVRGAKHSQHMEGKAVDIRVTGMSARRLKRVIEKLIKRGKILQGGVGLYRTHIHYDIRGTKSRWYKRYKRRK